MGNSPVSRIWKTARRAACMLVAAAAAAAPSPVLAQAQDFYAGKRLTILVNYDAGGPTDIEARLIARNIARHIPGQPTVIVQNMGGAGGIIGAKYLGEKAARDGSIVGYFTAAAQHAAFTPEKFSVDFRTYEFVAYFPNGRIHFMRTDVKPGIKTARDVMNAQLAHVGLPGVGADLPVTTPKLRIVWNPQGFGAPDVAGNSAQAYYPGDAFVDVIGDDLYDIRGHGATWAAAEKLYKAHPSKPFAFPEWGLWGFDDAQYVGARLLEILSRSSDPGAVLDALPDSINTPELNWKLAEGEPHRLIEGLQQSARFLGAREIIKLDGLRVEYADGFGLARASNTTPVIVLRFEGDTQDAIARIQAEFRAVLQAAKPGAQLPF